MTQSHLILFRETGIRFRTYDSPSGVLVVSSQSDLARYREKAARILGGPVQTVQADSFGTIYILKEKS